MSNLLVTSIFLLHIFYIRNNHAAGKVLGGNQVDICDMFYGSNSFIFLSLHIVYIFRFHWGIFGHALQVKVMTIYSTVFHFNRSYQKTKTC